jgi:hypothetical protein
MGMQWRGFKIVAAKAVNTLGKKATLDNIKTFGRKVKNTVRDVAGYVAPIAHGISTVATMAGHPEIAATAGKVAGVASGVANRLK